MATAARKAYARCRGRINYAEYGGRCAELRSSGGGALLWTSGSNSTLKYSPQLLSLTPPHNGGLLPLSFGLFHQQEVVRDLTVDLFTQLRMFPVSSSTVHSALHCILIPRRMYSGWRAVFTSPQPLPALCLRPASSRTRVARRWDERGIWFRSSSTTTRLFQDTTT
jgi:hypothetical protein